MFFYKKQKQKSYQNLIIEQLIIARIKSGTELISCP